MTKADKKLAVAARLERDQMVERDRKMMHNPVDWPRWPILPLKPRDGMYQGIECGFLLNEAKPTVYLGYIYALDAIYKQVVEETGDKHVTWDKIVAKLNKREFASWDDLLDVYTVD
jgi:hypothetical protein